MRPRACKIVATLGPASDPPERLMMLIKAGVNCFRLNFSHGARADHSRRIAAIREAETRAGHPIAIMADMQGPKIRVGTFEGGSINLRYGDVVTIEVLDPEDVSKKIKSIFGLESIVVENKIRISKERGHEFVPQLVQSFSDAILSVTVSKPTLEDVFVQLTGHRFWKEKDQ